MFEALKGQIDVGLDRPQQGFPTTSSGVTLTIRTAWQRVEVEQHSYAAPVAACDEILDRSPSVLVNPSWLVSKGRLVTKLGSQGEVAYRQANRSTVCNVRKPVKIGI